jgi:hypothetical protein
VHDLPSVTGQWSGAWLVSAPGPAPNKGLEVTAKSVRSCLAPASGKAGAGMLIVAGDGRGLPMDYDELERWTRVGFERGMRSRRGER